MRGFDKIIDEEGNFSRYNWEAQWVWKWWSIVKTWEWMIGVSYMSNRVIMSSVFGDQVFDHKQVEGDKWEGGADEWRSVENQDSESLEWWGCLLWRT